MVRTWWAWCRHGLEMRLTGKTWFGHSCDAKLILGPEPSGEMAWTLLCTCFYFCTCFCFAWPLKRDLWGFMNWDPLFFELWNGNLEMWFLRSHEMGPSGPSVMKRDHLVLSYETGPFKWSLSYELGPSGLELSNGTLWSWIMKWDPLVRPASCQPWGFSPCGLQFLGRRGIFLRSS